jgi:GT2 family glycosyltransferase
MQTGSVVVVAHNSGEQVEHCLRALGGHRGWEVIVIDNASRDDTLQRARHFACARIVANQVNRGFAGAVNQGVALAASDVLVILNPDAIPTEGALDALAEALRNTGAAAAGGLLLTTSGQVQRGMVVRRFPGLGSMLCEVLLINRLWPGNACNRSYRCLDLDYTRAQVVEQPAGAAMAFTRAAWQAVGGFDEGFYPVWFEDVDFCRRLHERGNSIIFCPQAVFRHAGGHSVVQVHFRERQMYWYGNLLRYFQKHHAGWRVSVLRFGLTCGMLLRSIATLLAGSAEVGRWTAVAFYLQIAWRYGLRRVPSPAPRPAVVPASSRVPS